MNIRRHLTYANVGVTICLFLAVAGGVAYGTRTIGSRDIKRHTIRAVNLKQRKAVRGIDVVRNTLGGREIAERKLNAHQFAPTAGGSALNCTLSTTNADCAKTTINLRERSRLLVIATGGEESLATPAHTACVIRIDRDLETAGESSPGEQSVDNTSPLAQNGFARTRVTPGALPPGRHTVALTCHTSLGAAKIDSPTIAVLAIGAG